MRMPSHTALCSFIFSAILTSALIPSSGDVALASAGAPAVQMAVQSVMNGLRSQGLAGGAELVLPPAVDAPASVPAATPSGPEKLTPDLLSKLLRLNTLKGTERVVPAPFANALGLGKPGQGWPDHDIGITFASDNLTHGFAVSRGTDQDVLISVRYPESIRTIRSTRDGKAVAGLVYDHTTNLITLMPIDQAQTGLDAEFAFWAAGIDKLLADGK
jgi:hypothetical protein